MNDTSRPLFPMPKTIGQRPGPGDLAGIYPPITGDIEADVAAVYVKRSTSPIDLIAEIEERLQRLTHRQMRDWVAKIGQVHDKLHPNEHKESVLGRSIPLAQLADVLDRVAHGD